MGKIEELKAEIKKLESKEPFDGAFFRCGQAGRFDHVLFEKAGDIEFVTNKTHAEELRNHAFAKRGIITEHTAGEVALLKKADLKAKGMAGTTEEDIEKRIRAEVENRVRSLGKKGDTTPDEAREIEAAKAYLDKYKTKYHHALGLKKLVALVADHQANG